MKAYGTRGADKKLMNDALKANKRATTRKLNLRKMSKKENKVLPTKDVIVAEDEEKHCEIDFDVAIATSKKRKEAIVLRPAKSKVPKPKVAGKVTHFSQNKEG